MVQEFVQIPVGVSAFCKPCGPDCHRPHKGPAHEETPTVSPSPSPSYMGYLGVNTTDVQQEVFEFLLPMTLDYEGIFDLLQPTLQSQWCRCNGCLLKLLHLGAQWTSHHYTINLLV